MGVYIKRESMVYFRWLGIIIFLSGCSVFSEPMKGAKPIIGVPVDSPHGWKNNIDGYCDRHNDIQC